MSPLYFNISWDVQTYLLCNFTNGLTLGRCERVCNDWNDRIFKTQSLWKQIFARENGYLPTKPLHFNWRKFYIHHYLFRLNLLADNFGNPTVISLPFHVRGFESEMGRTKDFFIHNKTLLLSGSKGNYYFDIELGTLYKEPKPDKSLSIRNNSLSTRRGLEFLSRRPWSIPSDNSANSANYKIKTLEENYYCCICEKSWASVAIYSFYEASTEKLVFLKLINTKHISHIQEEYFVFHNSEKKLEFWNWKKNIKLNEMDEIPLVDLGGVLKIFRLSGHYLIHLKCQGYIDVYDLMQGKKIYTRKGEQEYEKNSDSAPSDNIYTSKKNLVYVSDSGRKARAQIFKLSTGEILKENLYLKSRCDLQIFNEQLVCIPEDDPTAINIVDLDTGLLLNTFNVTQGPIQSNID